MKIIIFIIFLLINSAIFPQCEKLFEAYQKNSYDLLEEFLENWRKETKPITPEEYSILPEVEKNIYEIYSIFFKKQFVDMKINSTSDKTYKYYVVHSKIFYKVFKNTITDTSEDEHIYKKFLETEKDSIIYKYRVYNKNILPYNELGKTQKMEMFHIWYKIEDEINDSILNFHPAFEMDKSRFLYQRDFYNNCFNKFVWNKFDESYKKIYSKSQLEDINTECKKRIEFLKQNIGFIQRGQVIWTGSVYGFYPFMNNFHIGINDTFEYATIQYDMGSVTYWINIRKINNEWKIIGIEVDQW